MSFLFKLYLLSSNFKIPVSGLVTTIGSSHPADIYIDFAIVPTDGITASFALLTFKVFSVAKNLQSLLFLNILEAIANF